jgi:hypothetical protein
MVQAHFKFENEISNGSSEAFILNLPKLMSSANRREYHNVDKSGNAQLYTVGMKLWGTSVHTAAWGAGNTYVTRRAIKAWHDARVMMYKRAGISMKSLGYGRTLRPYLDQTHRDGTTPELATQTDSNLQIKPLYQGDEWTYSKAAVSTPPEAATFGSTAYMSDLVDTYDFTILGSSENEDAGGLAEGEDESSDISDQDSFVSVGMIEEWLDSFKTRPASVNSNVNQGLDADNALLQLRSQQGADKEEVLELAEDAQAEKRPWDLDGSAYTALMPLGFAQAYSGSDSCVFQVPAGLLYLNTKNTHGSAEQIKITLDILDIQDM